MSDLHSSSWMAWYSSLRYPFRCWMASKCFRCTWSSSNQVGSSFRRPNVNVFWLVLSRMSAPITEIHGCKLLSGISRMTIYLHLRSQGIATVRSRLMASLDSMSASVENLNVNPGFMKYLTSDQIRQPTRRNVTTETELRRLIFIRRAQSKEKQN